MQQGMKKEHLPSFPERESQNLGQHLRTAPFLDIRAPFYHHGNGDAAAPARPRYLNFSSQTAKVTALKMLQISTQLPFSNYG